MKNKIIAVFTACCMICGAFSLNVINTADNNTIRASAADSERETKHGKLTCFDYSPYYSNSNFGDFYVSTLDSVFYGSEAYYQGDSTSDIDWSKCTDVRDTSSYRSFVEVEWDEKANDFIIRDNTWGPYTYTGSITFSFEDMDFIIDLEYITYILTTTADYNWYTTTTTTTTSRPVTYTYTYPVTTTATYTYTYTYPRTTTTTTTATYPRTTTTTTTGRPVTYTYTYPVTTTATYTYTYPRTTTTTTATYPRTTTTTTTTRPVTYTYTYPVTYTYPRTTNTTTATTKTTTAPVLSLMIIPSSVNMKTGDTNKLAVIGASNLSDVVWTSGDTSVATVSDNGTVTAKGSGSTLIYAVYNGNVASCRINVDTEKHMVYGDTNEDGAVDLADATSIVQYIGNEDKYGLSAQGLTNADTNGDGKITGSDALIIQKIEAGQISIDQLPYKE